jgi:hypothetical protein
MLIGKRSCFCLIIAIIKIPLIGQFELLIVLFYPPANWVCFHQVSNYIYLS